MISKKDKELQDEIEKAKTLKDFYLENSLFFSWIKDCIRGIKYEAELKGRREAREEVLGKLALFLDEYRKIINDEVHDERAFAHCHTILSNINDKFIEKLKEGRK